MTFIVWCSKGKKPTFLEQVGVIMDMDSLMIPVCGVTALENNIRLTEVIKLVHRRFIIYLKLISNI